MQLEPFCGGKDLQRGAARSGAILRDHFQTSHSRVVMRGVVMKQRQAAASRGQRHVGRVLHRAVPPTDLAGVLLIAVLGVMDDEVRPLQECHMPLIARMMEPPGRRLPVRLMVRHVGQRRLMTGDAVGQRRRSVIQVLRLHEHLTDAEKPFIQFREMNAAPEVVQPHGEVGVLHLPGNGVLHAAMEAGVGVDVQLGVGVESRTEERKALDVVPMGMPDEEVDAEGLGRGLQEVMAQLPGACPAVQDDDRAVIGPDFHARGVTAILGSALARHGNGPAGSPEAYEQGSSSFQEAGVQRLEKYRIVLEYLTANQQKSRSWPDMLFLVRENHAKAGSRERKA